MVRGWRESCFRGLKKQRQKVELVSGSCARTHPLENTGGWSFCHQVGLESVLQPGTILPQPAARRWPRPRPRWRFTAELTGMLGGSGARLLLRGETGNSSCSGIVRKWGCLSQPGGEVTARVPAGGGSGCSVPDLLPVSVLGSALLSSLGPAVCPLLLPPCTFWQLDGPTRRSSCSVRPQFAPGRRGKAVRSQLLRPGQIPGVFLKEAGWGTATGSVCAATAIVWGEK